MREYSGGQVHGVEVVLLRDLREHRRYPGGLILDRAPTNSACGGFQDLSDCSLGIIIDGHFVRQPSVIVWNKVTTLCQPFAHSPDAVIGIDKADVDQFNEVSWSFLAWSPA